MFGFFSPFSAHPFRDTLQKGPKQLIFTNNHEQNVVEPIYHFSQLDSWRALLRPAFNNISGAVHQILEKAGLPNLHFYYKCRYYSPGFFFILFFSVFYSCYLTIWNIDKSREIYSIRIRSDRLRLRLVIHIFLPVVKSKYPSKI